MLKTLIIILILIPNLLISLTFKDGKQIGYNTIGFPSSEPHGLDAGKLWSQSLDKNFTRYGEISKKFEYRAKDCKAFDCERGEYKGAFGRTEVFINTKERGENWYAWSFFIDNSKLTYGSFSKNDKRFENHLIQFSQMKLSYQHKIFPQCKNRGGEMVFIFQYKPKIKGLAISRERCKKDGLYENNTKDDILIQEKNLFNQWHDFILHAKWGEKGFFKLYVNGDLTYIEEGHITNTYKYNNKLYGPSFRYGIYQNNAPKEFDGKIIAWYDGIAKAKQCTSYKFSELLKKLGYSCEKLGDLDNRVIKPVFTKWD